MTSPRPRGKASGLAALVVVAVVVVAFEALHVGSGPRDGSGAGSSGSSSTCQLSGLPPQAEATVEEIEGGGPFPYSQDGVTFDNREHLLPSEPSGYYHEYTVRTPGSSDRGTRRVIAGGGSPVDPADLYYTGDHYVSFCLITGVG